MSAEKLICPDCGTELARDAPKGFCPKCLFARAQLGGLLLDPADSQLLSVPDSASGPAAEAPDSALHGSARFGDYELLEEIARGGMGVVWRARQVSLNRLVAVKMILHGPLASRGYVERFKAEAAAAAHLQHPNIVAIHEVGEQEGRHFFSMDYVEGKNLAELVREGPLPAKRAAGYVKAITEAIHYAHQRHILHRDLKPSNVLIDAFDQPRITDFGLAKRLTSTQDSRGAPERASAAAAGLPTQDLTSTGQVLGSPNFMPPEQAAGRHNELGPPSDVYALGAILYHLVTGRPPFVAETVTDTLRLVAETDPVSPRLLTPSVPRDLNTICLKCLEKSPVKRYQTAQALADELGRFLRDEPIQAQPVNTPEKIWRWCRRKPAVAGTGAVAALSVLLGFAGILWQLQRAETQRQRAETGELTARRYLYDVDMDMAAQALEAGNQARAWQLVERHRPEKKSGIRDSKPGIQPDLRNWEWRYLWRECLGDELCTVVTHSNEVNEVAFSPDGRLLASASADSTVKISDVARGRELLTLNHRGNVNGLAFSPDGSLLASGGAEGIIWFWDTATWQPRNTITNGYKTSRLAFSPDGRSLAAAGAEGMTAWNVNSGQELARSKSRVVGAGGYPVGVAFAPDNRTVAYTKTTDAVGLWDTVTQTERLLPIDPTLWQVCAFAFSQDGSKLLGGGCGDVVKVWDIASGTVLTNVPTDGIEVKCLALSSNGQSLVAGCDDGRSRLWELDTWKQLGTLVGHLNAVRGVAFSPDGTLVASGSSDGTVKLWGTAPRADEHEKDAIEIPPVKEWRGQFSPDGRHYVAAVRDAVDAPPLLYTVWDIVQFRRIHSYPVPVANWVNAALANGGTRLAFGDANGAITLWDDEQSQVVAVLSENEGVAEMLFTPDGQTLVVLLDAGKIIVWDLTTHQPVQTYRLSISVMRISPDGRLLAAGEHNGQTHVWELRTGRELASFAASRGDLWDVGFSPDGGTLFTVDVENNLKLWELPSGRQKASIPRQLGRVSYAAFSGDGKRLVGCLAGGALKMWDLETYQEVGTFWGLQGEGYGISFLPDGETLVAVCARGIRRWRAAPFTETDADVSKDDLDEKQPGLARLLGYRLRVLVQRGKLDEVEPLCRELLARDRKLHVEDSASAEWHLNTLADVLWVQSRIGESAEWSRESLTLARKLYLNDPPNLEHRLDRLASVLSSQHKYAEAEPLAREVVESKRARLPAESDEIVGARNLLALLLADWAWAERDAAVPSRTSANNSVLPRRSATNSPATRAREAEMLERASLAARTKSMASTNIWLANPKWILGGALVSVIATDPSLTSESRLEKFTEAESLLLQAADRLLTDDQAASWWKRATLERLVRVYEVWNRFAPASGKAAKADEWTQKLAAFDLAAARKKLPNGNANE